MTVTEHLRLSRAKNNAFHLSQQRGLPAEARQALIEAQAARLQADADDPDHADDEWRNDKAPHADILRFYADYLERTA